MAKLCCSSNVLLLTMKCETTSKFDLMDTHSNEKKYTIQVGMFWTYVFGSIMGME